MALAPLATVADLEERLNRSLRAGEATRAQRLLEDASGVVRTFIRQQLTAGTSTVRVRPDGNRVRLPQRPVTAVAGVDDIDGNPLAFVWDGDDRLTLGTLGDRFDVEPVLAVRPVDVTYDHGYDEIPGDIVGVVCQIVGRALGSPSDRAGLTSETVGNYSYAVGAAAAAGPVGMLADERNALSAYRRVGGKVRML